MNSIRILILCAVLLPGVAETPAPVDLEKLRELISMDPYDISPLQSFAKQVVHEPDKNLRAHYLTLCYVGFLAHGQGDTAKQAYEALKTHHPDSSYVERLAPAKFMKNCPDCRRAAQTTVPCPVCQGSNVCMTCKGRGSLEGLNDKKRSCPSCRGTKHCIHCNRQGRVPSICSTCGGSTRVPDRDRMFLVYKRLLAAEAEPIRNGRWVRLWRDSPAGEDPVPETDP